MRRGTWARQLASALGNSNPSADVIHFISAWTKCENTAATYNPLASSHKTEGDSDFNGIVRNYPDNETGIRLTVDTLNGRYTGYSDIRQGIVSNNPEMALRGLYASPWGTSGLCVDLKYHSSTGIEDEELLSHPTTNQIADQIREYGKTHNTKLEHNTIADTADNIAYDPIGEAAKAAGVDATEYGQRAAYIIAGSLMVLVATVLAIRSLVPTQQIVKTIAEVAA